MGFTEEAVRGNYGHNELAEAREGVCSPLFQRVIILKCKHAQLKNSY